MSHWEWCCWNFTRLALFAWRHFACFFCDRTLASDRWTGRRMNRYSTYCSSKRAVPALHLVEKMGEPTKYSANGITVLIDLIKPSFDVVERLDARDVVDDDYTMSTAVVANEQNAIINSSSLSISSLASQIKYRHSVKVDQTDQNKIRNSHT